jgi:hypothetical protein
MSLSIIVGKLLDFHGGFKKKSSLYNKIHPEVILKMPLPRIGIKA